MIVRKPDGTPIPNVTVHLVQVLDGDTPDSPSESSSVYRMVTTDADGKATFTLTEHLPAGRYRAIPVSYSGVSANRGLHDQVHGLRSVHLLG